MVLPPYYYTPTDDEIWLYYKAISEGIQIPIMLYNNPVTSNVDMSAALVARLTRASRTSATSRSRARTWRGFAMSSKRPMAS